MKRVLSLVAALAVVAFVTAAYAKDNAKDKDNSTIKGTVAKASTSSITVTDKDGKDHTLIVAKDAKITCDGKECLASDLKSGTEVTVTLNATHKDEAERIEAKTK